ncbi:MAG TPA: hypothetical protein VKH15_11620 [Candidatus Acidoferrum sp.]|nr:hypothetical protein [Candidatus Acidoferrum sp.]
MKTRALVMTGIMALTVMASTQVAHAQDALVVNIPFEFIAGNTTMPAGEYSVKVSGPQGTLLIINRTSASASVLMTTNPAAASEPQAASKLVFNQYGNRYFLSQIWREGNANGRQLQKSSREQETAQVAKLQDQMQVILVASLPPNHR